MDTGERPPDTTESRGLFGLLARVWLSIPLWVIAAVGSVVAFGFVLLRAPDYLDFWNMGARVRLPSGELVKVPFTRVLIDPTFVLMAAAFVARHPPKRRNASGTAIAIALLGGMYPMIPFFVDGFLKFALPDVRSAWLPYFMEFRMPWWRTLGGALCIFIGNGLDVWAYAKLFRSFSVVPEARELVTAGPYRVDRHPVYLGQIIAQAGVWFFFAAFHGGWILFWAVFVAIQLYRSRLEENVLIEAFGDDYRRFASKAWWVWKRDAP